jgi:hypothetical protein
VLVWTQVEPDGQYRAQPAAVPAAAHVPGGSGPDSAGGLRVWAASFARARGIAEAELRVEPPLHPEELAGLELAVGAGLVTIEDDGSFRMVGAVEGKGPYNLFSRGVRVALNREYLIQIAAFAELVLRHRWPARRGGVRVRRLRPGGLCPGWVAGCMGEAKRDQRLLDAMLAELLSISRLDVEQATTNAARKPPPWWAMSLVPDYPITRRMLGVDPDGSRRIGLLRLDASSVQTAPGRIVWMIIGRIRGASDTGSEARQAHRFAPRP